MTKSCAGAVPWAHVDSAGRQLEHDVGGSGPRMDGKLGLHAALPGSPPGSLRNPCRTRRQRLRARQCAAASPPEANQSAIAICPRCHAPVADVGPSPAVISKAAAGMVERHRANRWPNFGCFVNIKPSRPSRHDNSPNQATLCPRRPHLRLRCPPPFIALVPISIQI